VLLGYPLLAVEAVELSMAKQELISADWSPVEVKLLNTVDIFSINQLYEKGGS